MRRQWNDPAIGQAFANLSQMFAPPGGGDMAGFAQARRSNFETGQLEALFADIDSFTPDQFDRRTAGLGIQRPDQGFGARDMANATARRGQDLDLIGRYATNNLTSDQAIPGVPAEIAQALDIPQLPGVSGAELGAPQSPLSETQMLAAILGDLPPNEQRARALQGVPVEQIIGQGGEAEFAFRPDAIGQAPAAQPDAVNFEPWLVLDPQSSEPRPMGLRTGPDGRLYSPTGEDMTERALQPTSRGGGGMDLEVGPDGGVRFRTGVNDYTVGTAGRLEQNAIRSRQTANNMVTLFDTLSADALGVRGQWNEQVVNRGLAQIYPDIARADVTAQQSFLRNTILQDARTLLQNDRLAQADRDAIDRLMPDPDAFWESLPRARSAVATVALLAAYNSEFADQMRGGQEALPPLDARIAGQLVDRGVIPPNVAEQAVNALFSARGQGSPQSGAAAQPGAAAQGAPGSTANPAEVLQDARDAISRGAPREAVINELRAMGIEPEGL